MFIKHTLKNKNQRYFFQKQELTEISEKLNWPHPSSFVLWFLSVQWKNTEVENKFSLSDFSSRANCFIVLIENSKKPLLSKWRMIHNNK